MQLILASTSPYRQAQLRQLGLTFSVQSPNVDEVVMPEESPVAFAERMAQTKCDAVAEHHANAIVVGADQVCEFEGQIIRKPGGHAAALEQLRQFSGQEVVFHSAVCIRHKKDVINLLTPTVVEFRTLSDELIEQYLQQDKPYDCAGSFKVESGGLRLMRSVRSDDPSALVGLPLIALNTALNQLEFEWT